MQMFPTNDHAVVAQIVANYSVKVKDMDTVLVVNSCARGQAVPESDLDMAILVNGSIDEVALENEWQEYAQTNKVIMAFRKRSPFSAVHLDFFNGTFEISDWDDGGGPDDYEIEIGNRVAYATPFQVAGPQFQELQSQWLPYYGEPQRQTRLAMVLAACRYDLDHVPFFVDRELKLQAFDRLHKAFKEFLQGLFIAEQTYPIAYNKWLEYQLTMIGKSDLYEPLLSVLSVSDLRTTDLCNNVRILMELVDGL
jgi:hypothetical protein